MAFNFQGTYTTGQLEKLKYFSKLQEQDLRNRIAWLQADLLRVGVFSTEYDDQTGYPVLFTVFPDNSYAAKLMLAYKILGGNPEQEMLLRTRDKPVFKTRGTPVTSDVTDLGAGVSIDYSNGRRQRSSQRFDRDLGFKIDRIKKWQLEAIKRKREILEFKIKKALDLSDQISEEIKLLQSMIEDESRSLDAIITEAVSIQFKPGTQTVLNDDQDIFGLGIGGKVDPTIPGDWDSAPAKGSIK